MISPDAEQRLRRLTQLPAAVCTIGVSHIWVRIKADHQEFESSLGDAPSHLMPMDSPDNVPLLHTPKPTNPDGITPVYANAAGMTGTITDIQIFFTQFRTSISPEGLQAGENVITAMVTFPIPLVPQIVASLNQFMEQHKARTLELKSSAPETKQ